MNEPVELHPASRVLDPAKNVVAWKSTQVLNPDCNGGSQEYERMERLLERMDKTHCSRCPGRSAWEIFKNLPCPTLVIVVGYEDRRRTKDRVLYANAAAQAALGFDPVGKSLDEDGLRACVIIGKQDIELDGHPVRILSFTC